VGPGFLEGKGDSMNSQEKRFECDKCGQKFESKNELQEHSRLCTGAGQGQGAKTRQAGGGQTQNV
jgi:hypothetical protein